MAADSAPSLALTAARTDLISFTEWARVTSFPSASKKITVGAEKTPYDEARAKPSV